MFQRGGLSLFYQQVLTLYSLSDCAHYVLIGSALCPSENLQISVFWEVIYCNLCLMITSSELYTFIPVGLDTGSRHRSLQETDSHILQLIGIVSSSEYKMVDISVSQ